MKKGSKLTPFFHTVAVEGMFAESKIFILIGTGVEEGKRRGRFLSGVGKVIKERRDARRKF